MSLLEAMATIGVESPHTVAEAPRLANEARTTLADLERLHAVLAEIRQQCPTLPVRAIHWMYAKHPIHPMHDALLRQEREGRAPWTPWPGAVLLRLLISSVYAVYLMWQILKIQWHLRRELATLRRQPFDLVAKTWRLGSRQPSKHDDFYYGNLQRELAARGVRMLLLTGNVKGKGWRVYARNVSTTLPWQLPEWSLIPWWAPYVMVWRQWRLCLRLRRLAAHARESLARRVISRASWDCLSRQTTSVGLFGWIGAAAVRYWKPRALLALYEGHGWEQCLWWGAKRANPMCRTVGYQHTILLPHNLALLGAGRQDHSGTQPDVLLCLGPRTQAMLAPSHARSTLVNFGTVRVTTTTVGRRPPSPAVETVLVMPEGLIPEERLIYNFALRAARTLPHRRFIFRRHPMYPFDEALVRELHEDPRQVPNVEVSEERPIDEDFARAGVVLYRGTSSALYAVLKGLKPIYLHDPAHHEVDPLFELDVWRERVGSVAELEDLLERYARTDGQAAIRDWDEAAAYVERYLKPVDDASIDDLLVAVGLAGRAA